MKRENNPVRKKSRRRISAGKKKNKRTPILTALLLLMVCAATFGGFTVARYALSQTGKSGLASAEEFYFTSDLLKEEGASYDVYNWGDGIPIQLKNYEDSLRISAKDISYTITTDPEKCEIVNEQGEVIGEETLTGNGVSTRKLKVIPTAEVNKVTVTVETKSPYRKKISATFTATDKLQPKYQIIDSSGEPASELILTGGAETTNLTLKWNASLMPDRTNKYLNFNNGTCTINVEASASYRILLFKTDPNMDYSRQSGDIIGTEINLQ